MKRRYVGLVLTVLLIVVGTGPASASGPSPVVPKIGERYGQLGAQWGQWAMSFPRADIPYFNPGGTVDLSAHQSGNTWFLAGAAWGLGAVTRTGTVPAGTYLFLPLANLLNDYPCPDPTFQPAQGQSLKDYLQTTGKAWFGSGLTDLFAEIDGVAVPDLTSYFATSNLFWFTADPALVDYDSCITGTPQRGVTLGYWLLLAPLSPGTHTLHFGAPTSWGQDITYIITVTPR